MPTNQSDLGIESFDALNKLYNQRAEPKFDLLVSDAPDPLDKYPDLKYLVETYANYPLKDDALDEFALACYELGMKHAA